MLLIALLVAGYVLGTVQTRFRNSGSTDPIGSAVRTINSPLTMMFTGIADGSSDFLTGMFQARSLVERNRQLESIARAASLYEETLIQLRQESDSYKKLLGFPIDGGKQRILGSVIEYWPREDRMTLNSGSRQGVKAGLPVVSSEGLVGVIETVTADTSQVLLVSSPKLKIGAKIINPPFSTGLLHGEGVDRLVVEFMDVNVPVKIGDLIVTTGHSEFIPSKITIGRVVQVQDEVELGRKRAQVYPSVQVGAVREVFILR